MRLIIKILLWFSALSALMWLAGQLLARRISEGDESSDAFTVAALMGGKEFRSRATSLRSGRAVVQMGGMDLDLREATLDPTGAHLDVRTSLGGVRVLVPDEWKVLVTTDAKGGDIEVDLREADELPDDAPRLDIDMVIRGGGALVTTQEERDVEIAPVKIG